MFAAPPEIPTRIVAALPDALRLDGLASRWAAGQPNVGDIHSLLEGPCALDDGRFFCVDVAHGRIFNVDGGTFRSIADYDGQPNGMRPYARGHMIVADYAHGVMLLCLDTGAVSPLITRYRAEPFLGVNDLIFAANGDLYFTDQGLSGLDTPNGRVFRQRPGCALELVLDHLPSPNGLVMNEADNALYVAMTRDNAIWRLPLTRDGGVSKVGKFIQMSGGIGPDGLAMDVEGNVFAAHVGLGCVWKFSPHGEPIARIISCAGRMTTNIAFGGADHCTLYVTEAQSGSILEAQLDVPGIAPVVDPSWTRETHAPAF